LLKRLMWYWKSDRLGPDILSTHFLLYFEKTARWICKKKFKQFGDGSEFRPFAYANCTFNISIGKNVIIRPGTSLYADDTEDGRIIIEDDIGIGAGVQVYVNNHRHDRNDVPIKYQGYYPSKAVKIKRGSWIGAGAIILPGVTIGKYAVVGAGSIVTRSVDSYTKVAGNPARILKQNL
jgi:acetyltransferase-like isoleucine patch superfamily enzyme